MMGYWCTEMLNIYWICGGSWSVFSGGIMCRLYNSIVSDSHFKHIQCFLRDDYWGMKSGTGIVFFWRWGGYYVQWGFPQKLFVLDRPLAYSFLMSPEFFHTCLPLTSVYVTVVIN